MNSRNRLPAPYKVLYFLVPVQPDRTILVIRPFVVLTCVLWLASKMNFLNILVHQSDVSCFHTFSSGLDLSCALFEIIVAKQKQKGTYYKKRMRTQRKIQVSCYKLGIKWVRKSRFVLVLRLIGWQAEWPTKFSWPITERGKTKLKQSRITNESPSKVSLWLD